MAIPTSGAVSFNDIQTEFGGTNPISLNEYYSAAANVPASGAIKVSDFYGQSAVTVGYWYARPLPDFPTTNNATRDAMKLSWSAGSGANILYSFVGSIPTIAFIHDADDGSSSAYDLKKDASTDINAAVVDSSCDTTGNVYIGINAGKQLMKMNSTGALLASGAVGARLLFYSVAAGNNCVFAAGTAGGIDGITNVSSACYPDNWRYCMPNTNFSTQVSGAISVDKSTRANVYWWERLSTITSGWLTSLTSAATVRYHRSWNTTGFGTFICDDKTSVNTSSEVFPVRFASNTLTFCSIDGAGAAPTLNWTRRVPTGQSLERVVADEAGNFYVFHRETAQNVLMTKVNSAGTAQWTQRIRTTKTPVAVRMWLTILDAVATGNEIFVAMEAINQTTTTVPTLTYFDDSVGESIVFKLPLDGSKTGTYANITISNVTTATLTTGSYSLTSRTATLSSNTDISVSNSSYIAANSNTLTAVSI